MVVDWLERDILEEKRAGNLRRVKIYKAAIKYLRAIEHIGNTVKITIRRLKRTLISSTICGRKGHVPSLRFRSGFTTIDVPEGAVARKVHQARVVCSRCSSVMIGWYDTDSEPLQSIGLDLRCSGEMRATGFTTGHVNQGPYSRPEWKIK